MNKNYFKVILSFSICIFIISTFMFFVLEISDTGFMPTCISIAFASIVYIFALIFYGISMKEEGKFVPVWAGLIIFVFILLLIIIIRFLVL